MRRQLLIATLIVLVPVAAMARSVYLNKVKIDNVSGLRNLKLDKVNVRFDDKGDLYIDAPGYKIQVVDGGGSQAGGAAQPEEGGEAKLTRKYFLVTEQTAPGMTDYDIDVYVNAQWIRKLRNGEDQIYADITRNLAPGKNTVLLVARKREGARSSVSPNHVFRVIVGEGNVGGDHVMIDRPVVDFKATAADSTDISKEFTFTTR